MAEDHAVGAFCPEHADTKAGLALVGETKVSAAAGFDLFLVRCRSDGFHQPLCCFGIQIRSLNWNHRTTDSKRRGLIDLNMEIRCALVDHQFQEVIHFVAHTIKSCLN